MYKGQPQEKRVKKVGAVGEERERHERQGNAKEQWGTKTQRGTNECMRSRNKRGGWYGGVCWKEGIKKTRERQRELQQMTGRGTANGADEITE